VSTISDTGHVVGSDGVYVPPTDRSIWRSGPIIIVLRAAVIALLLVLWQLLSGHLLPTYEISKPTDVVRTLGDLLSSSSAWKSIETTAVEVVVGFALGVAIGTLMGLVLGTFSLAGRVMEPLVAAFNGIPKIALAPLFVLVFGIGEWSKIAIAITGVAFVVFYNLYLGLREVKRELREIVQVMGGKPRHVLQYVTLPTLLSPFFAGLKAGGPLAILGVIAGEFIASYNGLGHMLYTYSTDLDAAGVFATLVILVAMSLIINGLLSQLDRYAIRRLGLTAGVDAQPRA
jgi:NitT/TauT family transport system permease protein